MIENAISSIISIEQGPRESILRIQRIIFYYYHNKCYIQLVKRRTEINKRKSRHDKIALVVFFNYFA